MIISKEVGINRLFERWIVSPHGMYPNTHQELVDEMKPLVRLITNKPYSVVVKTLEFKEDNPALSVGELIGLRRLMVDQVPPCTKMIVQFIITNRKIFITYTV